MVPVPTRQYVDKFLSQLLIMHFYIHIDCTTNMWVGSKKKNTHLDPVYCRYMIRHTDGEHDIGFQPKIVS